MPAEPFGAWSAGEVSRRHLVVARPLHPHAIIAFLSHTPSLRLADT